MPQWRSLAASFIAALFAFGVTSGPGASAPEPFEIPAILSLTGPGSFLGKNEQSGLLMIESNVNKSGGIEGRPIKFVIQDDGSDPKTAVQLANALIAKKVPVILGSSLVAACNAIAPLAKDGPVTFCFSAGYHPAPNSYNFTYGISTYDLLAVNMRYFRERGLKKIAILTSIDASGQDGERGIDAALALPENKGITVVAREHYSVTDTTVIAQMSRIKASGAQALLAWGTGTPIGTVFHGANDVGLDMPIAVSASNLIYAEMKQYRSFLPKELISAGLPCVALDSIPNGPLHSAVQTYVDSFKASGIRPDVAQAIGWDPALIVVGAFRKLGLKATAPQIKAYLEGLHDFAGANGMYDFRDGSQRGLTAKSGIMVRWDPARDTWVAISKFGGLALK
jgi:branched-chain amino acid transport system substrate-binding protein